MVQEALIALIASALVVLLVFKAKGALLGVRMDSNQKARMGGGSQLGRGGQNLNHGEEGAKSPGTGYGGGGGGVTGALASTGSAGIIIVWEFK